MKHLLIFIFSNFLVINVLSQSNLKADSSLTNFDYTKTESFNIPELSVCIDSALINSPLLKASDHQIAVILEDIKINKKTWLDFFLIDGNVRFGLYNQLTLTQQTANPDVSVQSAKEQLNYFAGVTLRIPFSYFTNNGNQRKKLEYNLKEIQEKKDELRNEIRKVVVKEYFTLKRLQDLIAVHLNNLQTAQIDMFKSKNDVKSGLIGMTEFAASSSAYTKAMEGFVNVKNEYYMQYHILSILIGTNLQTQKK